VKPRSAWGPEDFARATGRDAETIVVLKTKVGQGMISLADARQAAEVQGFDPDKIGKAVK
jgi:hypothetical protein